MSWMLASLIALALLGQSTTSGLYDLTADVPEVGSVSCGLSVPRGYKPERPVPLVVVLHPGGERMQIGMQRRINALYRPKAAGGRI